ncbi:DUF3368 domain-containing protein [Phormidium tenue]|uniref:Nucleotide-binding protein n=1 Tax=Phormidium tenue NIES-30 TaxID=549789 RepID=A0A1U7J4T5_9CYAN|nr:DUF3368 domain-containing protein [Phormidium tenue]MBD2232848.1 DUF3368 domain-containing protein [Phormidium tenue FACHB-1052]OKH47540.1 nucleotide-binding protein [Phormidium tenue NIES-30]
MQNVVEQLIIPNAVAEEVMDYKGSGAGQINLAQESWIRVEKLQSEEQMRLLLPTLDRGEAEVIALAIERRTTLVLMDELTGRKVAESLQLRVIGSVGLLIQAKQQGQIVAVKPLLESMHEAGIYFSRRFIAAVLEYVNEM